MHTNSMEKKNPTIPLIVLIIILLVLLIISTIGWTRARNELVNVQVRDSLSVCDDVSSIDAQVACVEQLSDLSKLLSDYEQKLK